MSIYAQGSYLKRAACLLGHDSCGRTRHMKSTVITLDTIDADENMPRAYILIIRWVWISNVSYMIDATIGTALILCVKLVAINRFACLDVWSFARSLERTSIVAHVLINCNSIERSRLEIKWRYVRFVCKEKLSCWDRTLNNIDI